MSIVLKENEWAAQMIESKTLGKRPFETLRRVARYYLDSGYSKSEVRKRLDIFLIQCDRAVSLPKWAATADRALSHALKYKAIDVDCVKITSAELKTIKSLDGKQLKRLAFTLLCLAKYYIAINPESDGWVNNKDNEIMSMANINTSIKRQSLMFWTLRENGLIQFSKKIDNTNVKVSFIGGDDVALEISDFRNLGYQYLKYIGEPYFECENCGITVKYNNPKNGRMQKYCKSCAAEITLQNNINCVMRKRIASY